MISNKLRPIFTVLSLVTVSYYLLFAAIIYYVIHTVFGPELMQFRLQPFFAWDSYYFDYYRDQHLGMLKIISQYFLQFLANPVTGALILTALFVGLAILLHHLLALNKHWYLKGIEFIPVFLILSSLKSYELGLELPILFILAAILMIPETLFSPRRIILRILYSLAAVTLVFFWFGILAAFVMAILSSLLEIRIAKSGWKFSILLLMAALLLILTRIFIGFSILKPILDTVSPESSQVVMPAYSNLLIVTATLFLLSFIVSLFPSLLSYLKRIPKYVLGTLPVVIILVAGVIFNKKLFRNPDKYKTQIEYYAYQKEWNEVLRYRNYLNIEDRIPIFEMNRALYQMGRLSQSLFKVPQNWGIHSLFLTIEFNRECTINNSDLFFDMGFIKGAQYWALEAQTYDPYSPRILRRLALCAILTGDRPMAEKYLDILTHSKFQKPWAETMRDEMNKDMGLNLKNTLFGERQIDFPLIYINNKNPNYDLLQILKKDSKNTMAFEYLMAYYLLSNEIGNFQYFLNEYGNYDRNKLPDTYQEALLMYMMTKGLSPEELNFTIDQRVKDRFRAFNKVLIEYKLNDARARNDLYRQFGDTFWYYMRYMSPAGKGATIKRKGI